jgi:hypothetical protein
MRCRHFFERHRSAGQGELQRHYTAQRDDRVVIDECFAFFSVHAYESNQWTAADSLHKADGN